MIFTSSPRPLTSFGGIETPDRVIALSGALVGGDVSGTRVTNAVQFRRGALVEGRQPQQVFLADLQRRYPPGLTLASTRESVGLRRSS